MKHVGDLIEQTTRGEKGKQKELARLCGVSPQAITGWIKSGKVDKKHYKIIASFCGVPVSKLHELNSIPSEISEPAGLPYEDQDIYELVEMWPNMPENIKNGIRNLVRNWLETIEPQLRTYLENASRHGQKKFNEHIENNVGKPGSKGQKSQENTDNSDNK